MSLKTPKTLLVCLITPDNTMIDPQAYKEEFYNLVHSNGIKETFGYFTILREIRPSTFITKGRLEEIKTLCKEHEIDEVIISEAITPHQESTLEKELGVTVFDRTHLILEIFEKRAHSAEAKLQTKIAFLEYKKTRVSGMGKHFSQQGGGIGTRGIGATQKEIDLDHIHHLLVKLKSDLKQLVKVRSTQRKERLRKNEYIIALVGYTNAGKTTIFNALTKSDNLVQDLLFATLDTSIRKTKIGTKQVLFSDTVGFIQKLPHHLIEAFKSTLEELLYAHIILHVVDISNPDWENHIITAHKVMKEIGVDLKKQIYIFNKIDKIDELQQSSLIKKLPEPYILIQANNKKSISKLISYIKLIIENESK